jgi:hypothetical protein
VSPQKPDPAQLIANAELIKDVPFLPLAALLQIKHVLGRAKDQADIALIENYLARSNDSALREKGG